MSEKCSIGVLGMGVMGRNLAYNLTHHGFSVAVYNRTPDYTQAALAEFPNAGFVPAYSLEEFVSSLQRPRKILIMITAGKPVDWAIEELEPLLEEGDIIIDGGNSFFKDTQRRYDELAAKGLHFCGMGVSGGESGARLGPALMPGTDKTTYEILKPFLDAIAAKAPADGQPCAAYLGTGGAGHYVKMVHNGIEYADMQLIAEIYTLLKLTGHTNQQMSAIFAQWNKTELDSYLIQITSQILRVKDQAGDELLDKILDVSAQKGTGKWTNQEAIDLGVDVSVLAAGLTARYISMFKQERVKAAQLFAGIKPGFVGDLPADDELLPLAQGALLAAKIIAYAQGFSLYRAASKAYGWDLQYAKIASSFRAGCIIRSTLLEPMMKAFDTKADLENLTFDPYFAGLIEKNLPALRKLVVLALQAGVAVPALSAALNYFDALTTERSNANLIQAQRDYFGAHTYERIDKPGHFHAEWESALDADSENPLAKEVQIDA